jgi:predicted nucleic acid-binding protein
LCPGPIVAATGLGFDSTVLIAHLRGDERATGLLLDAAGEGVLASVISRAEIEGGMLSGERRDVSRHRADVRARS